MIFSPGMFSISLHMAMGLCVAQLAHLLYNATAKGDFRGANSLHGRGACSGAQTAKITLHT